MYTLIVQNPKGEQMHLTGSDKYDVLDVSGLNPSPATINTSSIVGVDGSRYNSSRIEERNIVITLNIKTPIEENRINLYRYFQVKRYVKLYYQNDHRDVYIEGYVETFENNPFTQLQQPQISIICPDPFWKSNSEINVNFSNPLALFEFPFSISTDGIEFSRIEKITTTTIDMGEVASGAVIEFYATSNQILNPKFINLTTNEFFGVNFDMYLGDRIIINTKHGEKSVVLVRDGVTRNIMSDRMDGSKWITFESGVNDISFSADEGQHNLEVTVKAVQRFGGV